MSKVKSVFKEIVAKDLATLRQEYVSLAKDEMALRFQLAAKQLKDTTVIRKKKLLKARIKTAMSLKQKGKE